MKIIHIARPIAGVGVYIQLLTKNIASQKFKNVVLCNSEDKNSKLINADGEDIITRDIGLIREINIRRDIKSLQKIIAFIKKENPNLIHCHSAKAGILGRLAGLITKTPVLYTPHAYSYLSGESKLKKYIFKTIEKIFKFFPAKTLACSESEYERTIKDLRFANKKVLLWKNTVEDENFQNLNNIPLQVPNFFICTIGRPSFQKNTELLVKAIHEIKKKENTIHLVVLGVGFYSPTLEYIKKLIKNKNLENNITLVDFIDRKDCLQILEKSSLFVSTSRYEGLSYAGIEALMLSKPCVLTNVDGNRDLVDHGVNGFLTQQTEKDVAKYVLKILSNYSLREEMSSASRVKFEGEFNIKNTIKELEKIYIKEGKF